MSKLSKRRRGRLRQSGRKRQIAFGLLRRDGRHCHWCGDRLTWTDKGEHARVPHSDLTIDHLQPLEFGGSNDDDNLVLACWICNFERGQTQREALSEPVRAEIGRLRPSTLITSL